MTTTRVVTVELINPCVDYNWLGTPAIVGYPTGGFTVSHLDSLSISVLDPGSTYDNTSNYLCGPRSYTIVQTSPVVPDIISSGTVQLSELNPNASILVNPTTVAEVE